MPDHTSVIELNREHAMASPIAYCTLLGVSLGAYFSWPWFVLLPGAAVLTLIAILEQRQYRPRLRAIGMTDLLQTTAMASAGNGLLASLAAYAVGLVVRSVFGG